jgi:hypothetical protein
MTFPGPQLTRSNPRVWAEAAVEHKAPTDNAAASSHLHVSDEVADWNCTSGKLTLTHYPEMSMTSRARRNLPVVRREEVGMDVGIVKRNLPQEVSDAETRCICQGIAVHRIAEGFGRGAKVNGVRPAVLTPPHRGVIVYVPTIVDAEVGGKRETPAHFIQVHSCSRSWR